MEIYFKEKKNSTKNKNYQLFDMSNYFQETVEGR